MRGGLSRASSGAPSTARRSMHGSIVRPYEDDGTKRCDSGSGPRVRGVEQLSHIFLGWLFVFFHLARLDFPLRNLSKSNFMAESTKCGALKDVDWVRLIGVDLVKQDRDPNDFSTVWHLFQPAHLVGGSTFPKSQFNRCCCREAQVWLGRKNLLQTIRPTERPKASRLTDRQNLIGAQS